MFVNNISKSDFFLCFIKFVCISRLIIWLTVALFGLPFTNSDIFTKPCTSPNPLLESNKSTTPLFKPLASTAHINCARVLADDTDYMASLKSNRTVETEEPDLAIDCESIYDRNFYAAQPASIEEKNFL
uniref:Uncharacterized protein n=1 Tax=Ditylenchus dipsaci TaxID=166011 RepID=A0A915DLL9_9BILA